MDYNYLIGEKDFIPYKTISDSVSYAKKLQPLVKEAQDFDLKEQVGVHFLNDILNNYGSENMTINYSGVANGPFTLDMIVTANNGATGKVVSDDAASKVVVKSITEINKGDWAKATTFTGTGGTPPTATVTSIVYGPYYRLINGDSYTDGQGYSINFDGLKAAIVYWTTARYREQADENSTAIGFTQKNSPYSSHISEKRIAARITQARSGALAYFQEANKYLCDQVRKDSTLFSVWQKTCWKNKKQTGGVRITPVDKFNDENYIGYSNHY